MSNKYVTWVIVVAAVILIVVVAMIWKDGGLPGEMGTIAIPTATSTAAAGTSGAATAPAPIVISITSPAAGDVWKLGTQHVITWSKAPNVTGYVYLINAQTKNLVGVITPETGPQQTSYPWNTEHLSFSRSDPSQKDAVAGTYFVSMAFDGDHLPVISSPVFTIVD